jgi:hypothetical protein
MNQLTRSKERVSEHGEVFTPTPIVKDMLALLSDKEWADPTMICLEPTCGHGQFVVEAVDKKIAAGLSPVDACNTVFGLDIMRDNIKECRERVWANVKPLVQKKDLDRLRAIIVNNIVPVQDSLAFIKSGRWEAKKFYDKDPTGFGQVLTSKLQKEVLNAIKLKGVLHD